VSLNGEYIYIYREREREREREEFYSAIKKGIMLCHLQENRWNW
jgi:hypothetical protein